MGIATFGFGLFKVQGGLIMETKYLKSGKITIGLGNLKLSDKVAIFNLPAGKEYTCRQDCPGCYAKKAQKNYPTVLPCRIKNLESTWHESFVDQFVSLIEKSGVDICRFHESGDIYNDAYAAKIEAIAARLPRVKFYLYTKTHYRPRGINVVESILPDGELNYGPMPYALSLSKKYRAPICPITMLAARKVKNSYKCGDHCKACQTRDKVIFVIH
jgi:hypothetical protein